MNVRSLGQVLLGMLAFVLLVELATSLGNGSVRIGGAYVGPRVLLFVLLVDIAALVVISWSGRDRWEYDPQRDSED